MTHPTAHPLRRLATAMAALAVAGLALLGGPVPAGAHGGEGQLEVTETTREGDDVTVTVRLTYVEDGHGVPDATVTVVVDDGTPTPMIAGAEEGDYGATVVAAPGATIRVTSVEPEVTVEATAPEAAPTTTAPPTQTTETSDAAASTETTAPADGSDGDAPAVDGPSDVSDDATGEGDDDSGGNGLLIGGLVALVVVLGAVAAFVVLRKPTADTDTDDA